MPRKKPEVALKPDKREVQRIHKWKPGHDPADPDADPKSGWQYLKLSGDTPPDTRDKRDKFKKGGGPESGMPCMHCGEMTRIVDEVSALEIIEQEYVITNKEARKRLLKEKVAILICPRCESVTQFRADAIRHMRNKWLEKQK